jgi:hypothetical protein
MGHITRCSHAMLPRTQHRLGGRKLSRTLNQHISTKTVSDLFVPFHSSAHVLSGLITLAIDIILQHRDIAVDEVKRQKPWACQLQRVAEFEVSMLPAEQYSSSRNAAFSTAMKQRAEKDILPSLFDVVQSYEDHVFQYSLWTYKDIGEAPRGKTVSWQCIPRPVKHVSRAKRPRRAVQPKVELEEVPEINAIDDDESSGNETVPDDTMLKLAAKLLRYEEAKAARRKARAAVAQAKRSLQASPERTVEASTPVLAEEKSEPATPLAPQSPELEDAKPAPSSSFAQSMDHLRLQEASKEPSPVLDNQIQPVQCHTPRNSIANSALQHKHDDVKGGSFMSSEHQARQPDMKVQPPDTSMHHRSPPSGYANHTLVRADDDDVKVCSTMMVRSGVQQPPNGMHTLVDPMQWHNRHTIYGSDSLQPLQDTGSFAASGPSHYTQFATHSYMDSSDLALFNSCFPAQMGQSPYEAATNMDYTYNSEDLYAQLSAAVASAPPQASSSFNSLPYDFAGSRR